MICSMRSRRVLDVGGGRHGCNSHKRGMIVMNEVEMNGASLRSERHLYDPRVELWSLRTVS
jgi:hypothetical protein